MTRSYPRSLVLGLAALSATLGPGAGAQETDRAQRWDAGYEPPRTQWGHPNLQGNWANAWLTPLERPDGNGPTLTWQQVAQMESGEATKVAQGHEPSDPDRPPLEATEDVGNYNEFYFERGSEVAIVDGEPRTSLITFPADGRIPSLSAEGRRRKQEYDDFRGQFGDYDHPELRPLVERCIVYYASSPTGVLGPPMSHTAGYNNYYTIVQNADHVVLRAEMIHDIRIIRLGEPEPMPSHMRPWFGDSWGRWVGNTLVVTTTHVNLEQGFNESLDKIPYSEDYTVIERFTRVSDGTILYEFEVDDPGTYSEPWGGQVPWRAFDQQIYEYACHEGNYGMANVLSGARYQERQAREREGNR